jgi:hypothetical protein
MPVISVKASAYKPCAGDLKPKFTDEPEREKTICLRGSLSIRKCFSVETDLADRRFYRAFV